MSYFFDFFIKELKAITFAILVVIGFVFTLPLETHRYDVLLVYVIIVQFFLYKIGFESKKDILIIFIFHIIGLTMEIIEVSINQSWAYLNPGFFTIFNVPIFTGFMYACVGSYISKTLDILDISLSFFPERINVIILSILIYLNFIFNNYIYDLRIVLFIIIFILYYKSVLTFRLKNKDFKLPLILTFFLAAFFIWIAENIATYLKIWTYPDAIDVWQMVSLHKISSWALLVAVSGSIIFMFKGRIDEKR
ncbi:uncharacterized membrane protein YoaT (DUF817 family) [Bacilli bacterium PM5-3]|nr:uncharacterized membrane protein YoaT (DUF817 family) [Bacilli bacterium PM5-3]